jgi:hypothetical protein
MILIRTKIGEPGLLSRVWKSMGGLWFPDYDHVVDRRHNVLAILKNTEGHKTVIPAHNWVTNDGDLFYAHLACSSSGDDLFDTWEMQSAGTPAKTADRSAFTAIAGSILGEDATYPKTNDGDGDNTGAGVDVRTSRVSYSAASFSHAAITHGIITNSTAPGASEDILSGWAWAASINKTASDTLKCFLNHEFYGTTS